MALRRRRFGPDSARTKDIIRAPGTVAAREFFYRDNRDACLRGAGFGQTKAYQTTFGLAGLRDAGWNPTRQFVGSYQISMTPIESGPRSLKFTAVNDTTVSSFLYHIWGTSLLNHERSTVGYFGTTRQVFEWEEPLSCR